MPDVITQKVGPLPLVVWVAGGAGVVGLFLLMTHKGNNSAQGNQTNSVNALSPTEAQAFGTIEQQQQDVTNALTTLGQNQSALGGSMSTLSGLSQQEATTQGYALSTFNQLGQVWSSVKGTQSDVNALGRFLGWEFYQIPNRYAAYIPNQQPGGAVPAGSSVIGSV